MNLKIYVLTAAAAICGGVFAAEAAPVAATIKDVRVYQPENYSLARGATISNALNKYQLTLTVSKSNGTKAPETKLTLEAGQFGFSPLVDFLQLTVNGIPLKKTMIGANDFTEWTDGNKKGAQLKLNFDGAKYILRFWMRPDSPVLWGSLLADPESVETAEKIEIKMEVLPSMLAKDAENRVIFDGKADEYARRVVTASRTMEQSSTPFALTAEDSYLILQDAKFDGSAEDKGRGPCLAIFDDFANVATANLNLPNSWICQIFLTLKPEMKEFNFGLWQCEPRISNTDFAKKFTEEKSAFTR